MSQETRDLRPRRYLWPMPLLLVGAGIVEAGELNRWEGFLDQLFFPAALAYGAGAIWWTLELARGAGPRWLRAPLCWLPAVWPLVMATLGLRANDNAWIGIAAAWPVMVAPILAALVATWRIAFAPRPAA